MNDRRLRAAVLFGLLSAVALVAPRAHAQERSAFETLDFRLRAVADLDRNARFDGFWEPEPGAELAVETPFYAGSVELGAQFMAVSARDASAQPDYGSRFVFVGWAIRPRLARAVVGRTGVRVGSYRMSFDDVPATETRVEQELGIAATAGLSYELGKGWSLDASGRYRVVFTRLRIRQLFLAAGLGYEVTTPRWLKELLD